MAKAAKKAVKKATAKRAPAKKATKAAKKPAKKAAKKKRAAYGSFLFCSRLGTGRGAGPQDLINF